MKKNKTRALTIRLDEDLIEQMEYYRNHHSINWSDKIRKFIKQTCYKKQEVIHINKINEIKFKEITEEQAVKEANNG